MQTFALGEKLRGDCSIRFAPNTKERDTHIAQQNGCWGVNKMGNTLGVAKNIWLNKQLEKLRSKMPILHREKEMDTRKPNERLREFTWEDKLK